MTTQTQTRIQIPEGTWDADPVHSNANFEVEHAGVSVFRGGFKPIDAKLTSTESGVTLEGAVDVANISIDDENIRPHLLSPEFFDVERNPRIEYRSAELTGEADDLEVTGELSMAGVSLPVSAAGRLRGPVEVAGTGQKVALSLETTVDRTAFGMNWQMDLAPGVPALANHIKLIVELEFNKA
jgi:polyisoprenoid-binding protein YceI